MLNQTTIEMLNLFVYAVTFMFIQKDIKNPTIYSLILILSLGVFANDALLYTIGCISAVVGMTINGYLFYQNTKKSIA